MINPLARAADAVAPARLGRGYRWLLASAIVTNLGDGIALAAGPLLVASLTRDPFVVSLAFLVAHLPALLFGLFAGATADRVDRQRIIIVVNLARGAVLALLTLTIVGDVVSIWLVLVAMFALGTAEVFADVGSSSLLPRLVRREDLGLANARHPGRAPAAQQPHRAADRRGPVRRRDGAPVRRSMRSASPSAPCSCRGWSCRRPRTAPRAPSSVRADLAEGVRWLAAHPPMRTLAITIVLFNVTFGAAWSVLVLYADERLGMSAVGFGLITTAIAIGGIVGSLLVRAPRAPVLARRHHARRPAHRDPDAPRARADDLVARRRARDDGGVRGARVRLGHDGDGDPAAGGAGRAPRSGDRRVHGRRRRRASSSGRRSAGCSPASSGSRRRSGSGSSGRRCSWSCCGASSRNIAHAGDRRTRPPMPRSA